VTFELDKSILVKFMFCCLTLMAARCRACAYLGDSLVLMLTLWLV